MAGIQIRVDLQRDTVRPHLQKLARRMGSLRRPLSLIGSALVTSTKKRFQEGIGPVGGAGVIGGALQAATWPPLERSTIAKRRKASNKPLVDTGTLLRSITFHAGDKEVAIGTNHEIAPGVSPAIHQLGGKAGRNHAVTIPARPFLGIDPEDEHEIERTVFNYLVVEAA